MLGTGNALVTKCYNTCFAIKTDEKFFLVDAGGGNGILRQLELANIPLNSIQDLMLTHAHTDHLLGCVWVVRAVAQLIKSGARSVPFHVYANEDALSALEWICRRCLPPKLVALFGDTIKFIILADGDEFESCGIKMQCFDIKSTKCPQYGVEMRFPSGERLVCLGDEPLHESCKGRCRQADWLLCEAFCLHAQADLFKPYEKNHSTALDAGRIAHELDVRHLLLYHTEDTQLDRREELYQAEAARYFSGVIHVPPDLAKIALV